MKSETMNNVKIPQRGYSQNEVFSARRLGTKMEINILGKGGEKKKKPLSLSINIYGRLNTVKKMTEGQNTFF